MDRKQELEKQIKHHDHKYWVENDPEIPDQEYDSLVEELKRLDPNSQIINKINTPSTYRQKIKLDQDMLSLAKVYDSNDLISWCNKVARNENEAFLIQPKYDGWSAYYNGKILATRGDGQIGDNISDKIPLILIESNTQNIPLSEFNGKMNGEILLKKSVFEKNYKRILRKDGRNYKTERSALQGILGPKDVKLNLGQILTFVNYDLFSLELTLKDMKSYDWKALIKSAQSSDYPTDGLVIKLKDENYSKSLGSTSHHPRGQIAFKYGNPSGETILLDVKWYVGKDSTLNPVAIVEPVIIAGHEIKRANLHNAKNLLRLDINIGDRVIIERCGEIIPDVIKVIPGENRLPIIINECPECGCPISYRDPFLYCDNDSCPGSLVKRLADSCVRIGIDNLGESTISKLVDIGIEDLVDIFNLKEYEFLQLEGFATTKAKNLFNEIQKVKDSKIEDWKLLAALNITGIGRSISKKILSKVSLEKLRKMKIDDLENLPNIGRGRATDLHIGLEHNHDYINELLSILTITSTTNKTHLNRGSVCFTGKMDKPRSEYEKLAEKHGFETTSSVSSKLTYLVCSDPSSTKGKMKKAHKLGVKIIHITDFLKLL